VDGNGWLALIGSVVFAVVLRVSNMLVAWLSRALGVDPPDPIPNPVDVAASNPNRSTAPKRGATVTPEEPDPVEPDEPTDPTPEEPA
jgi:hypothetical protein